MSTLTLLDGVNRVLKKGHLIQGEAGELTDIVDTAYQTDVDLVVAGWNEVVRYLANFGIIPQHTTTSTITLVAGTREYALASGFQQFESDVLKDETNGHFILPYPGGYKAMFEDQLIPGNYTGRPLYWAINPDNFYVRFDREPTSEQAGDVYTYLYQDRISYDDKDDTFPFGDEVVEELVTPVVELWKMDRTQSFNEAMFNTYMARAIKKAKGTMMRDSY